MDMDREDAPSSGDVPGRATEKRVIALLTRPGVAFRVHAHPVAPTVTEATAQLPFPSEQLLKTVAFQAADAGWILAAIRGGDRIDYRKLAAAAGVRRADPRQVSVDALAGELDMAVGGVSPFSPTAAKVIVDQDAATLDTVFCGIGPNDRTLEIGLSDLIALVQARVESITQVRESPS
jgi:Cys-tRNA(Pro)/Cys-tRNA(Cys) deacylase